MSESLALAIVGHMVGDYLLQNDWMALNKKRNAAICMVHAVIWGWSVSLFGGFGSIACAVLTGLHFLQDHTNFITWYMDTLGQKQFKSGPCAPWSIIVVDNTWHLVTIVFAWKFL